MEDIGVIFGPEKLIDHILGAVESMVLVLSILVDHIDDVWSAQ